MRETVGRSITHRYVREILSCSNSAATRTELVGAGWLYRITERLLGGNYEGERARHGHGLDRVVFLDVCGG